eukprot:9957284-Lingulodinium_polyedra.AAC.1
MRDARPPRWLLPFPGERASAVGHGRPTALRRRAPANRAGKQAAIPHQLVAARRRGPGRPRR